MQRMRSAGGSVIIGTAHIPSRSARTTVCQKALKLRLVKKPARLSQARRRALRRSFSMRRETARSSSRAKQHSGKHKRPKALRKQHSAHEHTQRREEGYKRINRFFTLNASSISVFSVGLELARLLQLCGYFHADCRAYEPERHSTERGEYRSCRARKHLLIALSVEPNAEKH